MPAAFPDGWRAALAAKAAAEAGKDLAALAATGRARLERWHRYGFLADDDS